jgi:hypothetical protein
LYPFVSPTNFLDPKSNPEDPSKPYGPWKYEQLIKEAYQLTLNLHVTYDDVLHMSPRERDGLLKLIIEDRKKRNEAIEEAKKQYRAKRS